MSWRSATVELARLGSDFLFPRACWLCNRELPRNCESDRVLCATCTAEAAPLNPHRCQRCSAPVGPYLNTTAGCIHCQRERWHHRQVISLGPYSGSLRTACLRCKLPINAGLTCGLTRLLATRNESTLRDWQADLIVALPHYWYDRARHTHHAPDVIAEQLGQFLRIPVARHLLKKVRWTPKQAKLPASKRRGNLKSAFRVARSTRLDGLHVLLCDDVLTTGTTAHRAARELLNAGAASVSVAVIARDLLDRFTAPTRTD